MQPVLGQHGTRQEIRFVCFVCVGLLFFPHSASKTSLEISFETFLVLY